MMRTIGRISKEIDGAHERGSALLVSLMVMVGLSLLGLGFMAMSETENAISINERNYTQTLQVAEAGARAVVEWYQDPEWADSAGIMPPRSTRGDFMVERMVDTNADGTPDNIGLYKPDDDWFCCDKPFKDRPANRLWGTEASPDIAIRSHNADGTIHTAGDNFLNGANGLNERLFGANPEIRVSEIIVYAPPIIGGTVNANNFYDNTVSTVRYGLATIRVTAEKRQSPADRTSRVIARRNVKMVVSEWPFPGPQGPVQSNANIQTGGSVVVHWGKMTAQRDMFVKRPLVGLPWVKAADKAYVQYGYDSSVPWEANKAYRAGDIVHPVANIPADDDYDWKADNAGTSGATEPVWDNTVATMSEGSPAITWRRIPKRPFRIVSGGETRDDYAWLNEIVGKFYDDPWVEARARGNITNNVIGSSGVTGVYHPFKYSMGDDPLQQPDAGYSNWFQLQTITDGNDRKEVIFPRIDYQFWKDTAIAGQGQDGVYYLQWVDSDRFRDASGNVKTFKEWTNIDTGAQRGFYFFDTKTGTNPQVAGGDVYLTPAVDVQSAGANIWTMSGFIYLNAVSFGTQGIRGIGGRYNFPGEPYADVGYPDIDAGGNWIINTTAAGRPYVMKNAGNGIWNHEDLDGDDHFDLFLASKTIDRGFGGSTTLLLPVPYTPGCTPGENSDVGANCSEPHEPYLNIIYPQDACCSGASNPIPMQIGWQAQASQDRRPKKYKPGDVLPSVNASDFCTDSADFEDYCTSNGWDRDGYMDEWERATQDAPVLDGVFYNEGTMNSQGNARYFGSVLINKDIDNSGTNEVWFDERLIKDEWPPKNWPFPRVIVTAVQTDQ